MTRLEDVLRDSLAERAADVRATPALWARVEARSVARTRRSRGLAAAGTAVAVGLAAVVLPNLLDGSPQQPDILIDPSPADTPTPSVSDGAQPTPDASDEPQPTPETPPAALQPGPTFALRSVDDRLEVVRNWFGEGEPEVVAGLAGINTEDGVAGRVAILGVAVRPGSTLGDLEVVAVLDREGAAEYWWVRADARPEAASVRWSRFPDQHQPAGSSEAGGQQVPVFSEDHASGSRYLAWVEHSPVANPEAQLRIIGWTDGEGPGTGRTADDNTAFAVLDRPGLQLDAWNWQGDEAELVFTTSGDQGQASALTAGVERQADGAIALIDDCFCGEPGHGSHTHETVASTTTAGERVTAWLTAGGPDGVGVQYLVEGQGDATAFPVPPALRDHPDPASLELRLIGTTVVVVDRTEGIVWVLAGSSVDSFGGTGFDFLD